MNLTLANNVVHVSMEFALHSESVKIPGGIEKGVSSFAMAWSSVTLVQGSGTEIQMPLLIFGR